MPTVQPAANYRFNNIGGSADAIKSHSSVLFNERLAILFYLLDMKSMSLNTSYEVPMLLEVRACIKQIYKNVRTLLRNNPTMRASLNLDTKDDGIYVTDVAIGIIDKMIEYCEIEGYTSKRIFILVEELNKLEMMIKDTLQYYNYFIIPSFKQKPDIDMATEQYKGIANKKTIEELRGIVGKRNRIDFESLGVQRIEKQDMLDEDKEVLELNQEDIEYVNESEEEK